MRARVILLLIAAAAVLAAGACDRNGGDDSRTRINVLDSAFTQSWQTMQDTGVVYRIEVISPLGADTIRNVIPPAPVVVGDTLVIGLMQVSEDSSTPQRQIFRARLGPPGALEIKDRLVAIRESHPRQPANLQGQKQAPYAGGAPG